MNFIDIKPKTQLMLHIYKESKQLNIQVQLDRHLDDTTAVITLNYQGSQVLNFTGVTIDLEYGLQQAAPYMWKNVRVIFHRGYYILKVFATDGIKTNRRDSFRVSIGVNGRTNHQDLTTATVRDISHSGFALASRKSVDTLQKGDTIVVTFDDITFHIRLEGVLVRVEERDGIFVYGFKSTVFSPHLPQYLALKQRPAGGRVLRR